MEAVAVVEVMSVQPTSAKCTVLQLAGSAADAAAAPKVNAERAEAKANAVRVFFIIA